jgi:hypothetical protein
LSQDEINKALNIWKEDFFEKTGKSSAPFENAKDMYKKIDKINYGQSTWYSFEVLYTGEDRHKPGAPSWKHGSYKVYARDTHEVLASQLASSDFNGHYDYTAHKDTEQQPDGSWKPQYTSLMSGDWAWDKLVCSCCIFCTYHYFLTVWHRMSWQRTQT